jgi:hypothetical protein
MVTPALTNGDKEVRSERPHRLQKPSAILLEQSNSELPALLSQQQAITAFQAAEAARCAAETKLAIEAARAEPPSSSSRAMTPSTSQVL